MAKLSSPRTELAVLRAACHRDDLISSTVLTKIDESYFYSEEAQEIFTLAKQVRNQTGKAVPFRMLLEHPQISKDAANFFRNSQPVISEKSEAMRALAALGEFRRRRSLAEIANTIGDALNKPTVNSKALMEQAQTRLTRGRASKDDTVLVRFGHQDNAGDMIKRLLYEDRTNDIIPTGFKTFDSVNGGFFRGSLIGIAGTTGGGKSTLANQLAVNISSMGYPVDILPLEMSELEMSARISATVTRFDAMKILLQRMTAAEKKLVEERMLKWRKMLHRKQSYYAIHKPKEDVTMEEALSMMTAPVKIIDYMGLLANTDGDDQWRKLGAATRYAKIYAEATHSLVIVLAQLDQSGLIRYSRAMAEHMNNLWAFVANKDTREAGIINIEQQKARNQRMFSFSLKIDSDMMRVYDLPNNGVDYQMPKSSQQDDNLPNLADTV